VKLLEIQSSPRGESSDSIALTTSFIGACRSDNAAIVVDTLNVWHERLPEFDYEAIGAKYKAVKQETMTEAESNVWERIQSLIKRFQNADRIVIGTPCGTLACLTSSNALARKNLLPLRDRIVFIKDGQEFLPGVQAMLTPGHTQGHTGFLLIVRKSIAVFDR